MPKEIDNKFASRSKVKDFTFYLSLQSKILFWAKIGWESKTEKNDISDKFLTPGTLYSFPHSQNYVNILIELIEVMVCNYLNISILFIFLNYGQFCNT